MLPYKWNLQVGIPDVSRTVSGSDVAIKMAPLKASTKGETRGLSSTHHSYFASSNNISHLFPVRLLAPCLRRLHSRHCPFQHNNLRLGIWVQWWVHHWRYLHKDWVSLRKMRSDKLHVGYICLFNYNTYYFFSNLINLCDSKDVSMHFQGDFVEGYSSIPLFTILNFFQFV